jgi:hypothetical protein
VVGPSSLPGGLTAAPYNQALSASGGTSPYNFTVSAGDLPTGLSLSSSGSVNGTPSAAGTFSFTIRATDSVGFSGTRDFSVTIANSELDLTVPVVYITQAIQTQAFDVPLVKDRDGYLRAFVLAGQVNHATPQVRVRIYDGGSLLATYAISPPGTSTPTSIGESSLSNSWNQIIPGALIQPGYSLRVEVDPDNLISETDEANNTWPASGSAQALDVRDLAMLNMTLVPVNTTSGTGNVNAGNAGSFMDYPRRIHPIPDYDAVVRATMSSSATLAADGTGWDTMLSELTAQRTADGSSRYYFGLCHVGYYSGVAGLSWVGYPVGVGWDYLPSGSWVLAHEIGHNWNYGHTRCTGSEDRVDTGYPYPGGEIGAYGYDLWASSLKDQATYKDVMSYCNPQWISDYTYKKILAYRESSPIGLRGQAGEESPKEPCLLVWGLRRHGQILLEPSFFLSTRPSLLPSGPFSVEGLDESERILWSQSFDLLQSTDAGDPTSAGFCLAVPMSAVLLDQIQVLRIAEGGVERVRRGSAGLSVQQSPGRLPAAISVTSAGPDGVDLRWDSSRAPVVMVRDHDRDECIGFVRGGSTRLTTASRHLELLSSDGVHTRVQRWP